ncbi:hypothetical protein [Nocardia sp. XZ_19_385]|uniref:hypothetical protein n=1 Tax=Nocardia sp. XZ_19_385 TaxID=2769488 RepID=UPI001E5C9D69|nr:hypothetical protein [Nocardia sp. XZ_19_385]
MRAHIALASGPDAVFHDACELLSDFAVGYQDLIDEVHAGTRRLPTFPMDWW